MRTCFVGEARCAQPGGHAVILRLGRPADFISSSGRGQARLHWQRERFTLIRYVEFTLGGSQPLSQGDVAMQLTPLLSLYAVVTGLFAVALLIVPSQLMSVYGAAHLDTLQTILSRFIGSLFAGLAVMAWTARASEAGRAREAIVLGLTILNGLSAVVAVLAALSGVFNALAWGQAGLYALFTVFFVIAGRATMSPRARAP